MATSPTNNAHTDAEVSTIIQRFTAFALSEGLTKKSKEYKSRRRAFIASEVEAGFAAAFGGNAGSLGAWKDVLRTVGIEGGEALTSIKQCKAALKGTCVNIVDLVDAASAGHVMTSGVYTNETALAKYIKRTGKVFPLRRAKANNLLRQFLIKVN